jgi:uncharacterized membrane protein YgcG
MDMDAAALNLDNLHLAITHATAPAFMLGAVAAFLSILVSRLERIVDRNRALRAANDNPADQSLQEQVSASLSRRMVHLARAIYLSVLSALMTAALLTIAFLSALLGMGHGVVVAVMFAIALMLLMASLVELTREIRVYMATMHLD